MKIAVLSGKGGTGKTTLSVNLAYVSDFRFIDTDIEEPNAYIFIKPDVQSTQIVYNNFPKIDSEKCNLCGKCGNFCKFNAIIPAKNTVLVFKESCHDCGGCILVCPTGAISYEKREIGKIIKGIGENKIKLDYGELNIGELSGVKIIKELKKNIKKEENTIIDSPPGAACAVVAAIEGIDYAVLVTEPTPFGLSDMKIVVELLRNEKIDFGIVVNKSGLGNDEIYNYCEIEKIEILAKIPFDIEIAKLYSEGRILAEEKEYKKIFEEIITQIKKRGNEDGRY